MENKIIIDEYKRIEGNIIDIQYNSESFLGLNTLTAARKIRELIDKYNLTDDTEIINTVYDEGGFMEMSITETIADYKNVL